MLDAASTHLLSVFDRGRCASTAPSPWPTRTVAEDRALARRGRRGVDGAAARTTACCRSPSLRPDARGHRAQRRPHPDHGRRVGEPAPPYRTSPARGVPGAGRRPRWRSSTSRAATSTGSCPPIDAAWLAPPTARPGLDLELFADLDHAGPAVDRRRLLSTAPALPRRARSGPRRRLLAARERDARPHPRPAGTRSRSSKPGARDCSLDGEVVLDGTAGDTGAATSSSGWAATRSTARSSSWPGSRVSLVVEYSSRGRGRPRWR